jgi:hypothetical protein
MSLTGKGIIIWKASACEHGNTQAIVRKVQAAGLSHVVLKVADGVKPYNESHAPGLASALKAVGIEVWGWQYVYGDAPSEEAEAAIHTARQLRLDGFVVNAEREYDGKTGAAGVYMGRVASGLAGTPLALTSFRFPEYHPDFPWAEFLSHCTLNMPQILWVNSHNPTQQLEQSISQFQRIYPVVPIVPTGAAYEDGGWRPSSAELVEFMTAARQCGLDGFNLWNWDYAGSPQGGELWQAVRDFDWAGRGAPKDPVEELFQALNRSDIDAILRLYEPDGVLITSSSTLRGAHELRAYYTNLLLNVIPHGQFSVESRASRENVEQVTWNGSTRSPARAISGAQDTIALREGRIQYHTSLYQVA